MDSKAINDIFIWDTLDEISCCKLMSTTWTPLLHKSFCSQISNIVSDEICGLHELKKERFTVQNNYFYVKGVSIEAITLFLVFQLVHLKNNAQI